MNNRIKQIYRIISLSIKRLAGLADDTDYVKTIEGIHKSVVFRGYNVWILAFAIIIASVGLDINSTAVIIGAMLISPLMGPINGIGFSIGISDSELLRKSLKNFLMMVLISILVSTLYFLISPLSDAQSELLARTNPTIFDVIIAFFGGLAGIVAISRKEQPLMVISGVAIATALMPPLCTAGFGLATLQFNYFIGAFYLFFLNSVLIALATFIMVRKLHFPRKTYLDVDKSKAVNRTITIFTIIALTPSIFMAINVVREAAFNNNAILFINDIEESDILANSEIINAKREYSRKKQSITLSVVGKNITLEDREILNRKLADYGLEKTELRFKQTDVTPDSENELLLIENLLEKKERQISERDSIINSLNNNILNLNRMNLEYHKVAQEILVQYPDINRVSLNNMVYTVRDSLTEIVFPTLFLEWESQKSTHTKEKRQIQNWLRVRLSIDTVIIVD